MLVKCDVCLPQVRVAALQNLVKIMSLYYQYMETYMGPALFAVSNPMQQLGLSLWSLDVLLFLSEELKAELQTRSWTLSVTDIVASLVDHLSGLSQEIMHHAVKPDV